MFGLGFSEMILIAIIALIFIGPKQLPEVAKTLARFINELKRATDDLTKNINANPVAKKPNTPPETPLHASLGSSEPQVLNQETVTETKVEEPSNHKSDEKSKNEP